jgi:hypothetical protein
MTDSLLTVAASAPSMALRYAAAFFLVVVGIGLIYACIRLGGALRAADKLLVDTDTEIVPLLKQATETLDGVNTELGKIDVVMSSVVDATEKVDQTTRAVESAISVPAKKAAAFGAGVSQAVSSFFNRGNDASGAEPGADEAAAAWGGAGSASADPAAPPAGAAEAASSGSAPAPATSTTEGPAASTEGGSAPTEGESTAASEVTSQ